MKSLMINAPQTFTEVEKPLPEKKDGFAIMKIAYGAICGSDRNVWATGFPFSPGHEFSGWIAEPGDSGLAVGDAVCAPEIVPCGKCAACRSGRGNLCAELCSASPGLSMDGAYTEYIYVRSGYLRKLPEGMPLELGAIVEPVAVSLHGIHRLAPAAGEPVLIWGNGPIGVYAAACAKLSGAGKVYMVGRNQPRVDICNSYGFVDGCFSILDPEFDAKLAEVMPAGGFKYALDALGAEEAFDQIASKLAPGARLALLGLHSPRINFSAMAVLAKEIDLISGWFFTLDEYDEALAGVNANREMFAQTITNKIPNDAAVVQAMFEKLFLSGRNDEMKVLIDPSTNSQN